MKTVYFDNAATTQVRDEVINTITDVIKNNFGNPSSTHSFGRSSKVLVEQSRKTIAKHLHATASEIVFTSGGTEADNFAIQCSVKHLGVTHIITSRLEHHAVLHTVEELERNGRVRISYVNVNSNGEIDYNHLESLLHDDEKALVSLMLVNNEIGNILDVKRVGDLCKTHGALFHCDAVQFVGHFKIDLQDVHVDFLAASAHKFHGPKGVGFAYVRKNSGLKALLFGGEQERGLRAGTEAVHNIAAMETAIQVAYDALDEERQYITELKSYFIVEITKAIPGVTFNGLSGDLDKSTYTLVNVCLPFTADQGQILLFQLDLKGIACSKGSACQSGSLKGSHVLSEILSEDDMKKPSIRFSFSIYNTKAEVDYVISVLKAFNPN
ncbi:cysteine desulfurase family protein [Hanstruepera flava]|uniref:cysteine desulfurase family protein n=1 Tax=Hanstruepera flava TaxID=2930218 RepID=UPI002027FF25|nr:cysteine desulfurase family protein [Hanstruepera flava]